MTETTAPSKVARRVTGSTLETVRLHNRVGRRLRKAAKKLGLTKNGLMAKAIGDLVTSTLEDGRTSGAATLVGRES